MIAFLNLIRLRGPDCPHCLIADLLVNPFIIFTQSTLLIKENGEIEKGSTFHHDNPDSTTYKDKILKRKTTDLLKNFVG